MAEESVTPELIIRICADARARAASFPQVTVSADPLDNTAWVRLSSQANADEVAAALNAHGIATQELIGG